MCGLIAAFADSSAFNFSSMSEAVRRMEPRGPDGVGFWQGECAYLGHRRLAILDLDPRAAQPMYSPCGRYVIAFNGEIYNFGDLRQELVRQGVAFRTTSDTEVILALFARDGKAMLPRLHGMFAFIIWDRTTSRGFAARDPYGIKPLYVAQTPHAVLLSSQVKALLATGLVSRDPDARGQAGFWMLGSVPEPYTWYRDIRSIPAGHCAWIEQGRINTPQSWHDIADAWRAAPDVQPAAQEMRERVRLALRESVARHLVADVPVGVFLSGGVDSGALAGLMVEAGASQLWGVTLAYDEFNGRHEDEAPVATRMAEHYGIRHHVRRVHREEFHTDLPRILDAMDQPSVDGVNSWYASKAVAELGLKVVVSGVGGDELFQGYSSFRQLPRLVSAWSSVSGLPGVMGCARSLGRWQARHTGVDRWAHAADWLGTIEGAWWLRRSLFSPGELPRLMGADLAEEALQDFSAQAWVESMSGLLALDHRLALSQMESTIYLRNQLLRDSDWSSLDHSVELRTPLVDAHLLQQVQGMLAGFARFPNKSLLADAPAKALPLEVIKRPKTGFGIPIARWLAGEHVERIESGSRSWAREVAIAYDAGSS